MFGGHLAGVGIMPKDSHTESLTDVGLRIKKAKDRLSNWGPADLSPTFPLETDKNPVWRSFRKTNSTGTLGVDP